MIFSDADDHKWLLFRAKTAILVGFRDRRISWIICADISKEEKRSKFHSQACQSKGTPWVEEM